MSPARRALLIAVGSVFWAFFVFMILLVLHDDHVEVWVGLSLVAGAIAAGALWGNLILRRRPPAEAWKSTGKVPLWPLVGFAAAGSAVSASVPDGVLVGASAAMVTFWSAGLVVFVHDAVTTRRQTAMG